MNDHVDSQTAPQPGLRQTAALAIAVLGLPVVYRGTVRALLPRGEAKQRGPASRERWHLGERKGASKNRTSIAFGHALQEFEANGWIRRTPEVVVIRDRQALLEFALSAQPAIGREHLNFTGAITAIRNDLRRNRGTADRELIEQRHDEIEALLHLMHAPAAARRGTLATI